MAALKPGDMSGRQALVKVERLAEKSSAEQLPKPTAKVTRGDSRGPGKHYKGIYN